MNKFWIKSSQPESQLIVIVLNRLVKTIQAYSTDIRGLIMYTNSFMAHQKSSRARYISVTWNLMLCTSKKNSTKHLSYKTKATTPASQQNYDSHAKKLRYTYKYKEKYTLIHYANNFIHDSICYTLFPSIINFSKLTYQISDSIMRGVKWPWHVFMPLEFMI